MAKTEREHRQEIVEIGRLVYEKGWVAANDGNLSVRLDDGTILCTPTRVSKGRLLADELLIVDSQGNKLSGPGERTSEIGLHVGIYEMRPEIHAVVHAHPPFATGFAVAGRALNLALLPEVIVSLGCIPLAAYGLPGTPDLFEPMRPYVRKYDAVLMQNHGAVTYGPDLFNAFYKMETVEHFAKITLIAELLGGARPLPARDVDALIAARERYGMTNAPAREPFFPTVAEEQAEEDRTPLTRSELLSLVNEVLRARGLMV